VVSALDLVTEWLLVGIPEFCQTELFALLLNYLLPISLDSMVIPVCQITNDGCGSKINNCHVICFVTNNWFAGSVVSKMRPSAAKYASMYEGAKHLPNL
jgi:hypothetical protein